MSPEEIVACSMLSLMTAVGRAWPFQNTCAPETKFDPRTVSVKVPRPGRIVCGSKLARAGTGLIDAGGCVGGGLAVLVVTPNILPESSTARQRTFPPSVVVPVKVQL